MTMLSFESCLLSLSIHYKYNAHPSFSFCCSLFVGPSAGLNVLGALWLASRLGPGHTIVTVLCDSGLSYLSRDSAWLASKGITVRDNVSAAQLLAEFDANANVKIALPDAFAKRA